MYQVYKINKMDSAAATAVTLEEAVGLANKLAAKSKKTTYVIDTLIADLRKRVVHINLH